MLDIILYKIVSNLIRLRRFMTKNLASTFYEMHEIRITLGSFEWLNGLSNEQVNELKKDVSVFNREVDRRDL